MNKTRMIIIVAPSGAGKSSFVDRITAEFKVLRDTVTYTTRPMRAGETEGNPYYFVDAQKFESLIAKNFFVEWAHVHQNMYGTPCYQIEEAFQKNEVVIMDVDVQGADTFRSKYPDAKTIFILPPSIDELRRRVIKRDKKVPADLEIRMFNASKEIARAAEFDYQLVNDDFEASYAKFKKIIEELLAKS